VIAPSPEPFEGVVKQIQDRLPLEPEESLRLVDTYLNSRPGVLAPSVARLHLLGAAALLRLGRFDDVARRVSIAEQKIDVRTASYDHAELLSVKGYLDVQLQKLERGHALLQRAYEMFNDLGHDAHYAREIFTNIVWLSHSTMFTRAAKALELLLQALNYAHEHKLTHNRAARHADLGNIYLLLEQYERALEIFEQAKISTPQDDRSTLADILTWIGICHMNLRQIEKGIATSEQVLGLPNNRRNAHATALTTLAFCYIQRNDLQRAEATIKRAGDISEKGILRSIMNCLLYGQLYHKQGKYNEAIEKLEQALQDSREAKVVRFEHRAALELASLYITVGNESKALQCYRDLYSLHYHSFLARQIGEVERMMSEDPGNRYFTLLYEEDDVQEPVETVPQSQHSELVTQLTEVSLELNQKRRYLQQLLTSLNSLPDIRSTSLKQELDELQLGIKSQLNASVSWDSLDQKLLRLAGPDFQRALLKKGPNLTPTELRVCALIRCDLSTKEIAQMLGTSIRTVDTHRTRVRKKLGLGLSDNLYTFLMGVL
jgi:tetratricopeptide (TPR) repeat protein/DNA-binding CsgD family transcriptional regulator